MPLVLQIVEASDCPLLFRLPANLTTIQGTGYNGSTDQWIGAKKKTLDASDGGLGVGISEVILSSGLASPTVGLCVLIL